MIVADAASYFLVIQMLQYRQGVLAAGLEHVTHFSYRYLPLRLKVVHNAWDDLLISGGAEYYPFLYLYYLLALYEQIQ